MKRPQTTRVLLAATLLSLSFHSAHAQFGGRGGQQSGGGGGPSDERGGQRGSDMRRSVSLGQQLIEQHRALLQEVAEDLKLTPRQLVLWEAYQEKIGTLIADQLRIESSSTRRTSALQQIDVRVDTVRNRLTAMEDIAEAARTLYAALDLEQKKIADQRLAATVPPLYSGLGDSGTRGGSEGNGSPTRGERGSGGPNENR